MAELPLDRTYTAPAQLPSHFFSALASQLVDALGSVTAEPIAAIDGKLQHVIRSILVGANPDAIAVMQRGQGIPSVVDAYVLGQINFAEKLAASAAGSRIAESDLKMLRGPRFAPYIEELRYGERTNTELAKRLNQSEETISRNIGQLRREGLTDFRKYGRSVYNFLTPVALQILEAEDAKRDERELEVASDVNEFLVSLKQKQSPHMRAPMTFSTD